MQKIRFCLICLLTAGIFPEATVAKESSAPPAQLVLSIPEEVSIGAPDLPHAEQTWLTMIRGARKSIDIAQFYVNSKQGSPLEPVIAEIQAAIRRGVRVRFLISDASLSDTATLDRLKAIRGLTLRRLDLSHRNGGVLHAKYWIVDRDTIFVGSQNFDWKSLTQIQELGVLIHDRTLARHLESIFNSDWRRAGRAPSAAELRDSPAARSAMPSFFRGRGAVSGDIELVASPPLFNPAGIRSAEAALVEKLEGARQSVEIQLLSYTPVADKIEYWPVIDAALRAAAVRGVKVRLLVSHWNTAAPGVAHLKSLSLLPNIQVRIVTFPDHSSGFIPFARVIHSKYMIVDEETLWVGTSNWSRDYFRQMRNIEFIIRRPELVAEAGVLFEGLWKSDYAAPIDVNRNYPKPLRG